MTRKTPAGSPAGITRAFLNLLYPLTCEVCGCMLTPQPARVLCKACVEKIKPAAPDCTIKFNGVKVWSAYAYESVIKECVHLFKYKGRASLLSQLGGQLADFTKSRMDTEGIDAIIPVPLHKTRLKERGFNQSELLARRLAQHIRKPVYADAVKRVKYTLPQSGLSKTARSNNVSGAFRVTRPLKVRDKNILLIDDVLTTGSTLGECVKALSRSDAKSVQTLVLAKGT